MVSWLKIWILFRMSYTFCSANIRGSMCRYLFICAGICLYVQVVVYMCRYLFICTGICLYVQVFVYIYIYMYFFFRRNSPPVGSFTGFLDHTQRRTTVGRTPLDEWSARRRDLCLTTHNTHKWQTSMLPVGFEPTISAGERLQIYALDRAATGTGCTCV